MNTDTSKGYVLTYNPKDNTNTFLPYTEKSVHTKHKDMYKITTAKGYTITVTDDHSLATTGTNDFFAPLKPEEAIGHFVPIIHTVTYEVDPEVENEALHSLMQNAKENKPFHFTEDLLNIRVQYLACLIFLYFLPDKRFNTGSTYTCADSIELELAKIVMARLGLPIKIKGLTIDLDTDGDYLIPQQGKLVPYSKVYATDKTNPYLRLPYAWDIVTTVEKVKREDVTYDFTVPIFPLFIGNSILVYDTMQLHVPVSEAARKDALEKMLPSKNLFSPATGTPLMVPQQEQIFGLFNASRPITTFNAKTKFTKVEDPNALKRDIEYDKIKPSAPVLYKGRKTTAGLALVNSGLPEKLQVWDKPWNKKAVVNILSHVGKDTPQEYGKVAKHIMDMGGLFSYKDAVTFHASDFNSPTLRKTRDLYFKKVDQQLLAIDRGPGSPKQKEEKKTALLRKAQDFTKSLTDKAVNNSFQQWAYTGSKGSPSQVQQIIASPTVVADPQDKLIPTLIHRSYLEGLAPSDYFVSSFGTRKGTVGAKLSVAPAGALAKELISNVLDVVISEHDCHTTKGMTRDLNTDAANIINRYEAGTNRFIDANYLELLKRQGKKTVVVRSPATCKAKDGVCQMCYGYNEKRALPEIGENVGVVAAQAVTEPMTQMGLSSKHTAGTAAQKVTTFGDIKSFFNMTSTYKGAAVITETTGQITAIQSSPTGGHYVYVERKRYYIPPSRQIVVKVGDRVTAGDALTDGTLNIAKITPYKGVDAGRAAFVNEAYKLYSGAKQEGMLKKNFEVLARGIVNYVRIMDPGDFPEYVTGDEVDFNQLQANIRSHPTLKPPVAVPIQRGTSRGANYKSDWLANYGFKYLKGELIENAATGATSNLHSYHPLAAYARGAHFGQGLNGQY